MRTPIPGGLLVAIEGIDGAGKTTVAASLAQWCGERGFICSFSKEPTSLKHGQLLRESAKTGRFSVEEEVDLFLKDRLDHVERTIQPSLDSNSIVILDRYYWSTAAYQGSRGVDYAQIIQDNEAVIPLPDLIILLDVDPKNGIKRIRSRGDVPNNFESIESLKLAREIFLELHSRPSPKSVIINAESDLRDVCKQALTHFMIAAADKIGRSPNWASKEALNSIMSLLDSSPIES